jgi:ABC-2 type transport system permease protein
MPDILQAAAKFLPITHAIRAIQLAVYKGYPLGELKKEILLLSIMTCVLVPLGMRCFKFALRKARYQGSLSHY